MLRPLYKSDLQEILLIEESAHAIPWTEETFKTCFQSGYIGWVIEEDKSIIAFIITSMRTEECHVLNLCVSRSHQRNGWGRKLLEYALDHAKSQGVGIAYLEVRRSNFPAIALYRKMHFHLVGERKDYYPAAAGHEDALIFAKSLHEVTLGR